MTMAEQRATPEEELRMVTKLAAIGFALLRQWLEHASAIREVDPKLVESTKAFVQSLNKRPMPDATKGGPQ
jgi:hypothetical protein